MGSVVLHGFPASSYVWTARATCAAKGVDVDFKPLAPPQHKAPEHLERHPFGKVPVLEHDGFSLYETLAITDYVNNVFDGPALVPEDAKDRARMYQWVSVANAYLYQQAVAGFVFAFIFPGTEDGSPDQARIEKSIPELRHILGLFNTALSAGGSWLVGEQMTLADLFAAPLVLAVGNFPPGKELIGEFEHVGRYVGQIVQTPAIMSCAPG